MRGSLGALANPAVFTLVNEHGGMSITYAGHGSDSIVPACVDFAGKLGRTIDELRWSLRGHDLDLDQPGKALTVHLFNGRTLVAHAKAPIAPTKPRFSWPSIVDVLSRCVLVAFRSSLGPGLDYGAHWPRYDRISTAEVWRGAVLVAVIAGGGWGVTATIGLALAIGIGSCLVLNLGFWSRGDNEGWGAPARNTRSARRSIRPRWSVRRPVQLATVSQPIHPSLARPWPIDVLRLIAFHASTPTFDEGFDIAAIDGMLELDHEAIEAWCVSSRGRL